MPKAKKKQKMHLREEEKKMHDAKVIQYAVYQTKNIIAKGLNDDNSRRIGDIALTVKANLFSKENPRDWLYTYYHFFSFYENIGKSIITFCLRKIKFWNIFTGKLKQVYDDPMGNEITAVAVDRNVKRGFRYC